MPSRKKIIKKLYKQLKKDQADDVAIPAPTLVGIRFYIKHHSRAYQITIQDDLLPKNSSGQPPLEPPSKFILSQLEAQRIANITNPSNQVFAALLITSKFLAKDPLVSLSYPTLLTWHTSDNHRTYCLFAYLTYPMETRVYSASELFELRNASSANVLETIKFNPDVANIIKKANVPLPQPRRLMKKAREDISSSTESEDQVLFKGKTLVSTTNGVTEWKYRGRSGSELTSNEPLSAPAGLAAQQSEGFQKFFKAVVSPTHVRVTAGGRIVPNTRAATSPTAKWDNNRADQETHESIDTTKNGRPEVETRPQNNAPPSAGSQMPQPQGHPMFVQHLGMPFPLIPMHNGIPLAYGFPQSMPTAPNAPHFATTDAKAEPQKTAVAQPDDESGTSKSQPGPVRISPPTQFDHTKPYFFNGHLMYPAMGPAPMPGYNPTPFPNPYSPQGIAGNPAAMAAARMMSMGHFPPIGPMMGPEGLIPSPYGVAPGPSGSKVAQEPTHAGKPVVRPPISSIRPSEITKQQLDQLRAAAKYFEDQLLYNKHQIDEKATEAQVKDIKMRIHIFEYNLTMQLGFEARYYPKQAQSSEGAATGPAQEAAAPRDPPSRPLSMKENRSDNLSQDGSIGTQAPSIRQTQPSYRPRVKPKALRNRNTVGINATRSHGNSSVALDALEAHIKQRLELADEKKHSLPSGAALAPPFQPGTTPSVLSVSGDGRNESQPWSAAEYNNQQWQPTNAYPHCPQYQRGWDMMQSTNTHLARHSTPTNNQTSTGIFDPSAYSAPYLVGTLPKGVNPHNARETDYIYARELTGEEMRARHVYWGQVPTKGTGLPKFDGKDFYPPSPVKVDVKPQPQPQIPTGRPGLDYGFQLASSENDPFRSSRDGASILSQESTQKVSRAIPIVNPDNVGRGNGNKTPNSSSALTSRTGEDLGKAFDELKLASPPILNAEADGERKPATLDRRVMERSSNRSGHDLWQTMLKKGSASGTVLPSAISSTTATGYLPQYFGHAAASLSPAISSNATGPPARVASGADGKPFEIDGGIQQGLAAKLGENRHPREASAPEPDAAKEIRQRMLRDAERRGVIGPGWQ